MSSNYNDVLSQLVDAGFEISSLRVGTPRMVRCRVKGMRGKPGWYRLFEVASTGGATLIVGSFGVWTGSDPNPVTIDVDKKNFSREQNEALRKRIEADRVRADRQAKELSKRAARHAAIAWGKYSSEGDSPYLTSKGVRGHGVKYTPTSSVVIPLMDTGGRVHGLQFIRTPTQAQEAGRPRKEFWPEGMAMMGHFFLIGTPTWIVLIAEGYATAASLHEATGLPVAVAFNANNIPHVARALRKRYRTAYLLLCADDDDFQKCHACGARLSTSEHPEFCPECGQPHKKGNAGITMCSNTALELDCAWLKPEWHDPDGRRADFMEKGTKLTDFNDLHASASLLAVQTQVDAKLSALGWAPPRAKGRDKPGGGGKGAIAPIQYLDELLNRFSLVYGQGGTVFDSDEHLLMALSDMRDACMTRDIHRTWMEHPDRKIVRVEQVGFDPSETDESITCNLWGGWPTLPAPGRCDKLLELLSHMCSDDDDGVATADWVLRWLAYPIQHPGAKMKTTVVIHGGQGAGKNLFFEAVMAIYGKYGRVIDQDTVESQFNDWISKKLFLIADEVVARQDLYKVKNKLKGLITGDWIRVNPKGRSPYDEKNCCNMVFLSNESIPVVLEEGDRRYVVIWTADKLPFDFYQEVLAEIRNGGVAALHHHLLNMDLGNFHQGTPPPQTNAKAILTRMSADTTVRFFQDLEAGDIGSCSLQPCKSMDLYKVYKHWCIEHGHRHANHDKLLNTALRRHKAHTTRPRIIVGGRHKQTSVVWLGNGQAPPGEPEVKWLTDQVELFSRATSDYCGGV